MDLFISVPNVMNHSTIESVWNFIPVNGRTIDSNQENLEYGKLSKKHWKQRDFSGFSAIKAGNLGKSEA